ncbi:hypothetical protein Poli38472_001296 [Pythium oligandrum]|uniref:Uncharacterized protein n=1 Tax=Pythium oligandrum TaxID=41045 RepID=A0A8K1CUX8_PYTOL|nr:hypothetical protein Poli38472_001296 [Pythium oligandrum]|eukprot:TMW69140.1 hypothetical protein Poli38472_001296 [Pythium oligandrum]
MMTSTWTYDAATFDVDAKGVVSVNAYAPGQVGDEEPEARALVECMYTAQYKGIGLPEEQAVEATERAFGKEEPDCKRQFLFVWWSDEGVDSTKIVGFIGVSQNPENHVLISAPLIQTELVETQKSVVEKAMFQSSRQLADVLLQDLAVKKELKRAVPVWRELVNASDHYKKLCEDEGFSISAADRLEMTRFLKDAELKLDQASGGIEFRPLDLEDGTIVQVFEVLKQAFEPELKTFEAWKRHYPQQPRFAAELSFVAWDGNMPVCVAAVERLVVGEGGGDDEIPKLFATDTSIRASGAEIPVNPRLEYDPDYSERKVKIAKNATTGYICGVATLLSHRNKRLAQLTLQRCFHAAARAGLEKIVLGADRQNLSAVQAYIRAGMVETKAENDGRIAINRLATMSAVQSLLGTSPSNRYSTFQPVDSRTPQTTDATASWFSKLFFSYAKPVLDVGQTRQLDAEDLWQLHGENRASVAFQSFKRAYLKHDKSVVRAILSTQGLRFFLCGLGLFTMAACSIFAPIVLQHVIDAFSAPVMDMEVLVRWIGAFFVSRLVNGFCGAHVEFQFEIGLIRLIASLKSLLFEKALRRSVQSKIKDDKDTADISNLFSQDMYSLHWATTTMNKIWIIPTQIVVVIYLLYTLVSYAAFAGLATILLMMALNSWLTKVYMKYFFAIMTLQDSRMKVIKEIFAAMQTIKFNAWEKQIMNRIDTEREKEMVCISKFHYAVGLSVGLLRSSPLIVSTVSFAVYALVMKETLTASKVFTSIVLFNSIRMPLSQLPESFQACMQGWNALKRISKYLEIEEVDASAVSRDARGYPSDVMIAFENADFMWKAAAEGEEPKHVLKNVDFQVRKGEFAVVHGPVGAGKSSLLAAILGELPSATGKVFVRTEKVAYYSQQSWIQHLTIRDNILFGLPFDAKKYERVIDACGLVKDLAQFPAGDMTEIGQKGVNLSGGQKARVSLARACYSDADIYILDSPLAAVDAVVQSEIFSKCMCDLLKDKTIVLVTHLRDVIDAEAVNVKISLTEGGVSMVEHFQRKQSRRAFATFNAEAGDSESLGEVVQTTDGKLVEDEAREDGRVSMGVFWDTYAAFGGHATAIPFVITLVGGAVFSVCSDLWMSYWTGEMDSSEGSVSVDTGILVYGALGAIASFFLIARNLSNAYTSVKASRSLFRNMTSALFNAPLRFFDANPIGRIINRYSEDFNAIDYRLAFSFYGIFIVSVINFSQIIAAIYVIKYAGILILPLLWIYVRTSLYYLSSSREITRLLKVSNSPILSHVAQSEEGATVLRSFGLEFVARAQEENFKRLDAYNRVLYASTVAKEWFDVQVQLVGFGVVVLIVSALFVLRDYLSPGLVGLAFMYAVNIESQLSFMVSRWSFFESTMVSPERVIEYINIPTEGHRSDKIVVASSKSGQEWPASGSIAFENVVFSYKTGGEPVLKGLSFNIKPNEKVGIVGRTGAGKSSLTNALFRINELGSGRIVVDGQDISTINLQTLRSRMSIIPQVPVLFKGPLRAYMDPFNAYTDADIWQAFDKIGLKDMISALDGKLDHELSENGENFSVGERQMLCLARALLRQSRVVVMDEATASIDLATEQKLQSMIQREFVDATVLTIAHRLATVLDSDRILVLSDGRVVEFDTPKRLARVEGGVFRELAQESGHLAQLLG